VQPLPSLPALGVDFGERRIGLALCAAGSRLAVPLTTLERRTDRAAVGHIAALARENAAAALVVGEPRTLDGHRGDAAERVRRFGDKLAARTGLPVVYVGEALTSVEAERRLAEAGVDVRRHPGRVDAVAAQILLQEAVDRGLLAGTGGGPAA
jgi:putative Holliday junction resolvase